MGSSRSPNLQAMVHSSSPTTNRPFPTLLPTRYMLTLLPLGGATNRTYMLITFAPTPAGSYGCELNWKLDPTLQFVAKYGGSQIDVQQTTGYVPPYGPTWNNIIAANPPVTLGVSGTVNAVAGADATINTYACSNVGSGYGLAFVYKFVQWVEQSGVAAGVSFYMGQEMQSYTNTFIDYNC